MAGLNGDTIQDGGKIKEFILTLCDKIKMTRYGDPIILRFGKDPFVFGTTFFQPIEESNVSGRFFMSDISGHLVESNNRAFLDVFSCLPFNTQEAVDYSREFFQATAVQHDYKERNI